MTPKQKARELVGKFYDFMYLKLDYEQAKQCALIAVDEVLANTTKDGFYNQYWMEVKQEIYEL